MSNPTPEVCDLRPTELVAKLGMSRSYASELVKRKKTPSLEMAARIEREFGVPLSAWIPGKAGDGAEDVAGQDMGGEGACATASSPGKIVEVSGEA